MQILIKYIIMEKIKKINKQLQIVHNNYNLDKEFLLSNKKTKEYLFNKSPNNNNNTTRVVRLDNADMVSIIITISTFRGLLEENNRLVKEIDYYANKQGIKVPTNDTLPRLTLMSDNISNIYIILYKAEERYNMSFTYKYSLECNTGKILLSDKFEFDFFGTIISHRQLIFFVILYDKKYHFQGSGQKYELINRRDIENQMILEKMNIHLLRINERDNFEVLIHKFLNIIKNTREYVIVGKIKQSHSMRPSTRYTIFLEEYAKNFFIFSKMPINNICDSEDEFHDEYTQCNFSEHEGDDEYIVDSGVNKIIDKLSKLPKSSDIEKSHREEITLVGFCAKKYS